MSISPCWIHRLLWASHRGIALRAWQNSYLSLIYCFWRSWSSSLVFLINQLLNSLAMHCVLLERCMHAASFAVLSSRWPFHHIRKDKRRENAVHLNIAWTHSTLFSEEKSLWFLFFFLVFTSWSFRISVRRGFELGHFQIDVSGF